MVKTRPQIIDYLCDVLAPLGVVEPRSRFGGWGLYIDDVMFTLVRDQEAYFRADETTAGDYEALGLTRYKSPINRGIRMPYYPLPPDLFDDPDTMVDWAERALAAARRAKAAKPLNMKRAKAAKSAKTKKSARA